MSQRAFHQLLELDPTGFDEVPAGSAPIQPVSIGKLLHNLFVATHAQPVHDLVPNAHKLFRQGTEVPLTSKEFTLLAHFVKRQGRALTRDDILDAVWGSLVMVTSRSVDRCVTTLRGKIEPDAHRPT
jgi:hypothetical protein